MPESAPPGITEHTLSVLEFGKILPEIARRADSALGRELALGTAPAPDLERAVARARDLGEWLALESGAPSPPSLAVPDVRAPLDAAATPGAVLDPPELRDVALVARTARVVHDMLDTRAADAPSLAAETAPRLGRHLALEQAIERAIDEHARVRDGASAALERLRRRIESTRVAIGERLERLAGRIGAESFVTERGGRYTVAVPVELLGRVRGVVHDRSASGATVFLEPFEVVELGNRLREDEEAERAEVRRILAELTARVGPLASELARSAAALGELDALRAKGRLARDWRCVLPVLRRGGPIDLKNGRHPLVARAREALGEEVVPLTLALGAPARILVITGPNMGGKTVALKTLGLLTLMAMSGLGVPAADGTELGFFPTIVADIGDEQSIEENLSTFASHVRNLKDAVDSPGPQTLVLLDELGAGTDPAEGAALGQAVLEALSAGGAVAVVTTHHGTLKGMAMSNPSILNASMAFDPRDHTPLYALIPGVPGRSLGLEVADRLGFPAAALDRARALVPASEHHLSELIADVEKRRLALAQAAGDLAADRRALGALLAKYRGRLAEARALRDRVVERAQERAQGVVHEADELVRAARRALRLAGARSEPGPASRPDATRPAAGAVAASPAAFEPPADEQAAESGQGLGREIEILAGKLRSARDGRAVRAPAPPPGASGSGFEPGAAFWAIDLATVVEVVKGPDHAGRVLVRRGGFKLEIHGDRLRPATVEERALARPVARLPVREVTVEPPPSFELDLRGLTGDEAVAAVERYLEQAAVHGLSLVRLIHGKGTGVLKARVTEFLGTHPRVASFRPGETGEGGAGVTMVEIA